MSVRTGGQMKLKDNLISFIQNTSLHGVNFIGKESYSTKVRLTWLVLFLISLAYGITMISIEVKGKNEKFD